MNSKAQANAIKGAKSEVARAEREAAKAKEMLEAAQARFEYLERIAERARLILAEVQS